MSIPPGAGEKRPRFDDVRLNKRNQTRTQKRGEFRFVDSVFDDAQNGSRQLRPRRDVETVPAQKNERGGGRGSLIAVDERMVFRKREKIRRRELANIAIKVFAAERRERRKNRNAF